MASATSKVFISYARKDGAELAQRLLADLKKQGLDPWLDTQRIHGGATWTKVIEDALDESHIVLALLSPGSYTSEICRAEQLRALRKGKCVIPVLAQAGSDVPLHLEAKNYRNFTRDADYRQNLQSLLADIDEENGVELKEEYRQTYVTAPPLPVNFVERPEELNSLRNALITDDGGRHIALTALEGMGGIGKTVLAQALCNDPVVQHAFPDGVLWITVGKESTFDVVTRMREAGKGLNDDLARYDNELGCVNQFRTTVRSKAALIVLDDVWNARDIEPFRAESPRSRLLFTTRDSSIAAGVGAKEHLAELLTEKQSRNVLARWSGVTAGKLPPLAGELIKECGRLPLALAMIGAMLRGKPAPLWNRILELLRAADLEKIKAQFPDYPHTDLLRAIQISVDTLKSQDPTAYDRYLALAVMLEDMPIHPVVLQTLWGANEFSAAEMAEQLIGLSLAQHNSGEGTIKLHDLQLDYVRAQYPDKVALDLIHGALRLSSHVISKDPGQFASQMVGRLLAKKEQPGIGRFMTNIAASAPRPTLQPQWPTLHPPGAALLRTLQGHTDFVVGVAITPDGQRAVSASWDNTLKVWDLESGRELLSLQGHSDLVFDVAICPNGLLAVSASRDNTLKVWNLERGRELLSLQGHSGSVFGVAVCPDGCRAVSASDDHTLKVWELATGRELLSLQGHSGAVNSVAVTPDGYRVVSASTDNTLKVWELATGRELLSLQGHSNSINCVAITPDGCRAVSASGSFATPGDNTLKVWELATGRELLSLHGHSSSVNYVAITPDGHRAVSASGAFSGEHMLKVWDLENGCEVLSLLGHSKAVTSVAVTPNGRRAVSASRDNTLKIWDLGSSHERLSLLGHSGSVLGVAVCPDGCRAVSASDDSTLKVWELATGRELLSLEGHSGSVTGVAVCPDGHRAVSACWDNSLKVWNLATGREMLSLRGHSDHVRGVAVTPDGRRAVSASWDRTLKVWDLTTGRELLSLEGHSAAVFSVAITPDGHRAISASGDRAISASGDRAISASGAFDLPGDNTLRIWDLASGHELLSLQGHRHRILGVAVTPDGRHAVSASLDETLKLWDLATGRELLCLQGHSDGVTGVTVTPDGQRAVSTSDDRTLKVWDLKNGRCLATFTCDADPGCCACVDAHTFFVGDEGGRIHLLRLEE